MAMFRRQRRASVPGPSSHDQQRDGSTPTFSLGSVRLYQPDEQLRKRLPSGAGSIAPYLQALVATGERVLASAAQRLPDMGVLIVVGVRAPDRIQIWCEPVDGRLPDEVWSSLMTELVGSGHEVRPVVAGDFAFALEGMVGAGPSVAFPEVPQAWVDAIQDASGPVSVPDDVFARFFAN